MNNQQLQYNIKEESFVDVPVRCLVFLLKKMAIYDLFEKYAKDGRFKKSIYSIASLLMIALQMLLFRSGSKNNFYQNKKLGRSYRNMGVLAGIENGGFPHSKTIDDAFLSLDPLSLESIPFEIFKKMRVSKIFKNHPALKNNKAYRLSIDAIHTHTYYPHSQHACKACPFCLKRERKAKNGQIKVWYVHVEVVARLIFEGGLQLPLYSYPIRKRQRWENLSEDALKQECEQTAFPIVLEKVRYYLPKMKIKVLLDGLHANETSINILKKFHYDWEIVLKRLKTVQEEIDPIDAQRRCSSSNRFNIDQTASFTNDIPYGDGTLNAIEFSEHAEKKTSKRFAKKTTNDVYYQWIVSEKADKDNVFNLAEEGRSRWQEEDLFNSIKNRGFNIQHDYSRHHICQRIWHLLTFIAFCLTSILMLSDFGIKSRCKTVTISAFMKQMFQDLLYLTYETIFLSSYPQNLRFTLWEAAG